MLWRWILSAKFMRLRASRMLVTKNTLKHKNTIPLPPREQLCNRYCSNKHTLSDSFWRRTVPSSSAALFLLPIDRNARIHCSCILVPIRQERVCCPDWMRVPGTPGYSLELASLISDEVTALSFTHRVVDVLSTLVSHPTIPSYSSCVFVNRIFSPVRWRPVKWILGVGKSRTT